MADPARVFSLPRFDDSTLVAQLVASDLGHIQLAENWGTKIAPNPKVYRTQIPLLSMAIGMEAACTSWVGLRDSGDC